MRAKLQNELFIVTEGLIAQCRGTAPYPWQWLQRGKSEQPAHSKAVGQQTNTTNPRLTWIQQCPLEMVNSLVRYTRVEGSQRHRRYVLGWQKGELKLEVSEVHDSYRLRGSKLWLWGGLVKWQRCKGWVWVTAEKWQACHHRWLSYVCHPHMLTSNSIYGAVWTRSTVDQRLLQTPTSQHSLQLDLTYLSAML